MHSPGDWLVTLDEDLQHRPQHIVTLLLAALGDASDIVYARPEKPMHEHIWYRDMASRLTKRLAAGLTGNSNTQLFNSFRLMRGSVARAASSGSIHDAYFNMLLSWFTDRVLAIQLSLQVERENGTSSYTLRKLLAHTPTGVVCAHRLLTCWRGTRSARHAIGLALAVYTLAVVVQHLQRSLAVTATTHSEPCSATGPRRYPSDVAVYMLAHNLSGNILNQMHTDGYLLSVLALNSRVYVDSRTAILYQYAHYQRSPEIEQSVSAFAEELDRYDIDFVILNNRMPNHTLAYYSGTVTLHFSGERYSLFSHDGSNFPSLSRLQIQPDCWQPHASAQIMREVDLVHQILPAESIFSSFET